MSYVYDVVVLSRPIWPDLRSVANKVRARTEWATWITEVKEGDKLTAVGQRFIATGRLLGRDMDVDGTLTDFEPLRVVTLEGTTSLGGTWKWRTAFTSVGAGTSTDLTYDYQAPGKLTAVFDRLLIERTVERQFRDAAETFRDLVMAMVPQPV